MLLSRRNVLKGGLAAAMGAGSGAGIYGAAYERHHLELTSTSLPISGLAPAHEGLRIAFITDLHHSALVSADDVAAAVSTALAAKPDLIALGGDYVTRADPAYVEPVAELLAPLHAPYGVFAVLGNHDDERQVPRALVRRGFAVLRDQRSRLIVRGEPLEVAGIDFWTKGTTDIARVLKGGVGTVLLLAHDPRRLIEASALDVGGVLSGHTHGGQIVLPVVGALAARRFPIPSGLISRENTSMYVSRGVGTVYVPIRIGCPPEVAMVVLTNRTE
jgi:predicted MPP superfamily phosphohydrolase